MPAATIRPLDLDRDAERLATMWNESDDGWPGSWTSGQPMTAEMIREWERDTEHLAVFVAEIDDEIVGYCSLSESTRKGEGYLGLLNVNPRFHGHSIGRRLIQATIDVSIEKGWQRQTLHTWSANYKAVPTYKKTGHFWAPDTSVWMQSFVPGALQMPLARPFFERHDWYACQVREIDQKQDDMRWQGIPVFSQRWEADGEHLSIQIDQASRAPLAVETDEVLVAALPKERKPIKGDETSIELRIANKGVSPIELFYHVTGAKGLEVDDRGRISVPPGQTISRDVTVKVTSEAPAKLDSGCAPSVRCLAMVNDTPVELYPGFKPRPPISLSTFPESLSVQPNSDATVDLVMHNATAEPYSATVHIAAPEALVLQATEQELALPANRWRRVPLRLFAEPGVHTARVRLEPHGDDAPEPVDQTLVIMAPRAGELVWHETDEHLRLENGTARIKVNRKGGRIAVERIADSKAIVEVGPLLGPPHFPPAFRDASFQLSAHSEGTAAVVSMRAEPDRLGGTEYHQELRIMPNGLISLRAWLQNLSTKVRTCALGLGTGADKDDLGWIAMPLATGIVHAPWNAVAQTWDDVPRDPRELAEPWLAWEHDGAVVGIAWQDGLARIVADWGIRLHTKAAELGPGERSLPLELAMWAGPGDWRTARERLAPWYGGDPTTTAATRDILRAHIEPSVLLTTQDIAEATLVVDSAIMRPQDVTVAITSEGHVRPEPETIALKELTRHSPQRVGIAFATPGRMGAYQGACKLCSAFQQSGEPFHVIRAGTGAQTVITETERDGHSVWHIDNGLTVFEVAPSFGPSLIGWLQEGDNLLTSSFPEPRGYSWLYPWFGGLHMAVWTPEKDVWEGLLHTETYVTAPVQEEDVLGLTWHGVRLACEPQIEGLEDLTVETFYLTLGGSNLLRQVIRFANHRPAPRKLTFSHTLAASLRGSLEDMVLMAKGLYREPSPWSVWAGERYWGVAHNPREGLAMALVSPHPNIEASDQGRSGRTLGTMQEVHLAPEADAVYTLFVVACDTVDGAIAYAALKDYAG
jgi:GNAT superfamily N-acetyltransferase